MVIPYPASSSSENKFKVTQSKNLIDQGPGSPSDHPDLLEEIFVALVLEVLALTYWEDVVNVFSLQVIPSDEGDEDLLLELTYPSNSPQRTDQPESLLLEAAGIHLLGNLEKQNY